MRVFKTRAFQKWLSKQPLTDEMLSKAVSEIDRGLVDASLGGSLFKKRIALPGRGKSGSVRTLLAIKHGYKAFFLYGFEKNQRDSLTAREEKAYKLIAKTILEYTDMELDERLSNKSLIEIDYQPEI